MVESEDNVRAELAAKVEMEVEMEVEIAGCVEGRKMLFDAGPFRCGGLEDGVSFDLGTGPFVFRFRDLERMYEAAKAERES